MKRGRQPRQTARRGRDVLRDPALNKGIGFPLEERRALGLTGLLPPAVLTLEQQCQRAYGQYLSQVGDLAKATYLANLQNRNEVLFFRLLIDHMSEMLPIVYTPTVGEVIQHYSGEYRRPGGVYLSIDEPEAIEDALRNYGLGADELDIIVATDAEGILGIGDWGAGGIGIAVGKLAIYTAAAGIDPDRVMPLMLDAGTDNERLLTDPFYIGNRHERVRGPRYDAFVDRFVEVASRLFPNTLLHWEDFGTDNGRRILDRHREGACTFNDDIQGTGAVVLAAVLGGVRASGLPLRAHRVVVFGAGSAGIGIADEIRAAMMQGGLSASEATARFWCLGSRGLLLENDPRLREFQRRYARPIDQTAGWAGTRLLDVVRNVRPTILIGTSAIAGAFTEDVVREMAVHADRPIILALSNPTALSEARPDDLIAWTEGRGLIGTGSPFPPVTYHRNTYVIAQANNALVYPGLGLGVIASRAWRVTDTMIAAAARALAGLVTVDTPGAPLLPQVTDLRAVSVAVATAVARAADAEGVAKRSSGNWRASIQALMWEPAYRPLGATQDR
jgi:malate dehydrogenase (oxaloacetate-decarboxylating)